jgi:hypothetical protein
MTDTDIYDKAVEILETWRTLRPGKKFFGMSADEFAETITASGEARKELDQLGVQISEVLSRRDKADIITRRAVLRVINGVKGDPEEGEDSQLLAAMGYLPHTAKSSLSGAARKLRSAAKAAAAIAEDKEVKS